MQQAVSPLSLDLSRSDGRDARLILAKQISVFCVYVCCVYVRKRGAAAAEAVSLPAINAELIKALFEHS